MPLIVESTTTVVAALLLSVLSGGLEAFGQHLVQADVLVLPSGQESATSSPSDIHVEVGKKAYQVESIRPATQLKKVVVFDLTAIPEEDVDCFVERMKEAVVQFQGQSVQFFVIPRDESINWFSNGHDSYYLFDDRQKADKTGCSGGAKDGEQRKGSKRPPFSAWTSLGQVLKGLWGGRGPVQLLWVGEGFPLDQPQNPQPYVRDPQLITVAPNVAATWMESITRLGLTLFPIIWESPGQHIKLGANDASYAGGEAVGCAGDLFPCLEATFRRASNGWIMHVSGPPVQARNAGFPPELQAWYLNNPSTPFLKRPFAIPADPSQPIPYDELLPAPTIPLFSSWLDTKPGCRPDKDGIAPPRGITLYVPRDVIQKGGTHLDVYTSVVGSPQSGPNLHDRNTKSLKLRTGLDLAAAPTTGGPAEACVVLPPSSHLPAEFGIVVFNSELYWAGTARVAEGSPHP